MSPISKGKAIVTGILSSFLSTAPTASQATPAASPPETTLRESGRPSDAAVKAIMEKWALMEEQTGDSILEKKKFVLFTQPKFVRAKRPK